VTRFQDSQQTAIIKIQVTWNAHIKKVGLLIINYGGNLDIEGLDNKGCFLDEYTEK
jgi:hypothetical protein